MTPQTDLLSIIAQVNAISSKADIEEFAQEKLAQWGLTPKGWSFGWHTKRSAFGTCNIKHKTVKLSLFLFDSISREEQQDTVLHEIAHALDFETRGRSDHSVHWRVWAVRVGAKPERCKTIEDPQKQAEVASRSKYTMRCPAGHEFQRHRIMRQKASCPTCNPTRFDERFMLMMIQNY